MHILCAGLSHKTATLDLRERVAFTEDELSAVLEELGRRYAETELAVVSTCNRTEFYIARPLHGHPRLDALIAWLAAKRGIHPTTLGEACYHHDNVAAIRQAMCVAGGLDSMVLGEHQVLGQFKRAYDAAQRAGTVGPVLHKVFQSALATGKRLRHETAINTGRTSIASVAVDFAHGLFHRFDDKTVLALGAGKMIERALEQFMALGVGRLAVCNRSAERSATLAARFGGQAAGFEALQQQLIDADVVICSTGSSEPIVTVECVRAIAGRRRYRPMFVIDIAVPRDVAPAVGELEGVYLYDLDDLQAALNQQMAQRGGELERCMAIVADAAEQCHAAIQRADLSELIHLLRRELHAIGEAETQRTVNKLSQSDPAQAGQLVAEHTQRLVNKLLHLPLSEMHRRGAGEAAMYAAALRRLFKVGGSEDLRPPESTAPDDDAETPAPTRPHDTQAAEH